MRKSFPVMRYISYLLLLSILSPFTLRAQQQPVVTECACTAATAANKEAVARHQERNLGAAGKSYGQALQQAPPVAPTDEERALVLKFAPRLLTTANEPFTLKDAAAILHPRAPWIAYHLFWDDDIDFPDDNDPCDHEVIWVRLDPQRTHILEYYTYFHGWLLRGLPQNGQATVVSQWGKHGSMPAGWDTMRISVDRQEPETRYLRRPDSTATLLDYNKALYRKLSTTGRESQRSPLGKGWPDKFSGSWEDFSRFSKPAPLADLLRRNDYVLKACLNNAVINRYFLRYNFAAKTEWPAALCQDIR